MNKSNLKTLMGNVMFSIDFLSMADILIHNIKNKKITLLKFKLTKEYLIITIKYTAYIFDINNLNEVIAICIKCNYADFCHYFVNDDNCIRIDEFTFIDDNLTYYYELNDGNLIIIKN